MTGGSSMPSLSTSFSLNLSTSNPQTWSAKCCYPDLSSFTLYSKHISTSISLCLCQGECLDRRRVPWWCSG